MAYSTTPRARLPRVAGLLLLAAMPAPGALPAQQGAPTGADSATVVPGPHFAAGRLHRMAMGAGYRDLWTMPLRLPLLPPDTLGGLTPTGLGGGLQTVSLVLQAGNGREYRFRPLVKTPGGGLPEDVRDTWIHDVILDLGASLVPAGALVTGPILDAAGVLHAPPRLYVMPDHPFLGEHRARFAGKPGLLEERPEEDEARGITFAGASEIKGTEKFLEALEEEPGHRLAAREFLAARLVDLLLGDWDRHADQWRWARFDTGAGSLWRPIPRDRDYAFVRYGGVAARVGSRFAPMLNPYTERYGGTVPGLISNAEVVDRRLLGPLPRAVWDSVAAALRARISDDVIDAGVDRMPPEYRPVLAADLRRILRARRDSIPLAARAFYQHLALVPELHATDGADLLRAERLPDGGLRVRLWTGAEPAGEPYVDRTFVPGETDEVRVNLHGGDDRAVVEGSGSPILLRVLGGGGDDHLADRGRGGRTALYDHRGENRFSPAAGTVVDRREYHGPVRGLKVAGLNPPRYWGSEFAPFAPVAGWRSFNGLVVGGGPSWTRYGFRRHPWASRQTLLALWAPTTSRFGVEYHGRFRRTGTDVVTGVFARASDLEAVAFHGYGNDAPAPLEPRDYVVRERQLLLQPGVTLPVARGAALAAAGELRRSLPEPVAGAPADRLAPLGARAFTAAGARLAATLDRVDDEALPRSGVRARLEGAGFPGVWAANGGPTDGFGRLGATVAGYLSPLGGGPTLALRAGGERLWGDYPLQYAATLGGSRTLRGYRWNRFAGDASLHGSAELRQVLTRARLVLRGDLGVLALADAGRVWHQGRSPGDWHTALGGGVFFHTLERTLSLTVAQGEKPTVYLGLALPY